MNPPDWRIYITPGLVFISAVIAFFAMRNTRSVARQRATLDLIEKMESVEHYRDINATFSNLRRTIGFAHLSNPQSDEDKIARRCVTDYLNHYEMVAIGFQQGILDAAFYRAWMEGAFVRDWNAAIDWIQRERWKCRDDGTWYYYPRHYEYYQAYACMWSKESIRLRSAL